MSVIEDAIFAYFVEKTLDKTLEALGTFKKLSFRVKSEPGVEIDFSGINFPSVGILGFGRCGTNVALQVTKLVLDAKEAYLRSVSSQLASTTASKPTGVAKTGADGILDRWFRRRTPNSDESKSVFLLEPIIVIGDLDRDIHGKVSNFESNTQAIREKYTKLHVLNLQEIYGGGTGNNPIASQYLSKIALARDVNDFHAAEWRAIHAYLVDSAGIKQNQTRLFFYVFSAGGGTGSGMGAEFALAQQFGFFSQIQDQKEQQGPTPRVTPASPSIENHERKERPGISEPIFGYGIAVLPQGSGSGLKSMQTVHCNTGRLLVKYFADEMKCLNAWRQETSSAAGVRQPLALKPWNSLLLVSNDIMGYCQKTDAGAQLSVSDMEAITNAYVSQQLFNILTAQSLAEDYDPGYLKAAGIDIGDTIRLDANDLYLSLSGPTAVGYGEAEVTSEKQPPPLDVRDLLLRTVGIPALNKSTTAIEGISLLPHDIEPYRACLDAIAKNRNFTPLNEINLFKRCSSLIAIVSIPRQFKLLSGQLGEIKIALEEMFPNTRLKRYCLVIGTARSLSITLLISKSSCTCPEVVNTISAYGKRCFYSKLIPAPVTPENESLKTKPDANIANDSEFEDTLLEYILKRNPPDQKLRSMMNKAENPQGNMEAPWGQAAMLYEQKHRELLHGIEHRPISSVYVTQDDFILSLNYLREAIRYKREGTKPVSISTAEAEE